ncbi:MAG: leucyl aminopeptidase [Candidatus Marinimicrobia bacterium]|nr:leucyl aminopeptidase [Candidatus Neomarinimicrobiota bacterium]
MSYVKQVEHTPKPDFTRPLDFLALGVFKDKGLQPGHQAVDGALDGLLGKVIERGDFKGKKGDSLVLFTGGPLARVALVGLGETSKFTTEVARLAAGNAVGLAIKHNQPGCALLGFETELPAEELTQAMVEGLILGSYRFQDYKKPEKDDKVLDQLALYGPAESDSLVRGNITATAVCFARDLQNHPANIMTPTRIAEAAEEIARSPRMSCRVFDREQFTKLGMGALAGVALGANQPPKFIIMEYKGGPQGAAPVALVGKGLTFDSGGISIKPADRMDEMKFDMSGAATVLGIMRVLAELQPAINVVAAIPSTENMSGGSAQRPGDIVTAYNGKTIEVLNTDAEGRLILADALSYVVDRHKPVAIIDFATLTGAVLIAIGHRATGIMGNNEDLLADVQRASATTGERVWELPLWEEYSEDIKSKVADIKNIGMARLAGTIAGGVFLKEFVGETPWVHLDIAGTAWQDKDQPYTPGGGSGVAVRMVTQLILDRCS